MTFADTQRLFRHWDRNPPLRSLVSAIAHALGVKISTDVVDTSQHLTAEEAMRMMAVTGGRIDGVGKIGAG